MQTIQVGSQVTNDEISGKVTRIFQDAEYPERKTVEVEFVGDFGYTRYEWVPIQNLRMKR